MNKIKVNDIFLESTSLIAQTFSVNNLGDITTRQGGSSNNFSFPLSSVNRKALGFSEDVNTTNRLPYQRVEASLFENNTFIAKGVLKINRITNENIEATFFSDNAEWFNLIKDKTLKDLNLIDLNHTYTAANIFASFGNTEGYIYPLIDYGQFSLDSLSLPIAVEQLYPATYVRTIFERIFRDINYEIEGELLDLFEFNKSVIPFSLADLSNDQNFIDDNTLRFTIETQTVGEGTVFTLNKAAPTQTFDALINSSYTVRLRILVESTNNVNALHKFFIQGASLPPLMITEAIFNDNQVLLEAQIDNVEISAGESLSLFFNSPSVNRVINIDSSNSFIEIIPGTAKREGNEIDLATTLPEIKQSDFIKYIFNAFGVIATTDKVQNKVSLDLFRNVRTRIPEAVNWSDKIDTESSRTIDFTELISDYGNRSIFNYKEDSNDLLAERYLAQNGIRFGSGFFIIDNQHISNEKEIYEAPFSPFLNVLSFSNQIYIPSIPIFERDNTNDTPFTASADSSGDTALTVANSSNYSAGQKVNITGNDVYNGAFNVLSVPNETTIVIDTPFVSNESGFIRQLIFNSQSEAEPKIGLIVTNQSVFELTGGSETFISISGLSTALIPFCWFAKAPYTTNTDVFKQSLSFGDITFTIDQENLLNDYWNEYRELLSQMKYITVDMALNAADISNLDFTTPVYIDFFKSYFYINAVKEYTGSQDLTEVELIRIPT